MNYHGIDITDGGQRRLEEWCFTSLLVGRSLPDLQQNGFEILTLDILRNKSEDLHNPKTWAYVWQLASEGRLKMIFGGPPCRSTSRLRHQQPSFELRGLGTSEKVLVTGDTALILKTKKVRPLVVY